MLSGPLSDGQLYISSQWDETEGGLGTLPHFTQQRIRALEATPGGFQTEEYRLLKLMRRQCVVGGGGKSRKGNLF